MRLVKFWVNFLLTQLLNESQRKEIITNLSVVDSIVQKGNKDK